MGLVMGLAIGCSGVTNGRRRLAVDHSPILNFFKLVHGIISMKQLIARSRSLLALLALSGGFTLLPSNLTAADTLIPLGATWKYLDNGVDQGTAWIAPGFDDSA